MRRTEALVGQTQADTLSVAKVRRAWAALLTGLAFGGAV